jgi:hypothetical protein
MMRVTILGCWTGIALAIAAAPAQAAWHGYINKEASFSFVAPGDVKTEKGAYRSTIAGPRVATVYKSVDDNIEYKVTVVDFAGGASDGAAVIKEASTQLSANKKVLADSEARVESSYGRKMTVDLPNNGGRSMAAVYFNSGHLIELQATVLPANGDYGTPDIGRFVDSLAFGAGREEADATELKLAK